MGAKDCARLQQYRAQMTSAERERLHATPVNHPEPGLMRSALFLKFPQLSFSDWAIQRLEALADQLALPANVGIVLP
jgi:hypothetical protein